jgi:hypothetical protein
VTSQQRQRDAHIEPRLGYDRLLVEEGLRVFQIVECVEIALLQTSRKPEKAVREPAKGPAGPAPAPSICPHCVRT